MSSFFTSLRLKAVGLARKLASLACLSLSTVVLVLPLQGQAASGSNPAASSTPRQAVKVQGGGVKPAPKRQAMRRILIPAKPSMGMQAGLHRVNDPLSLRSSVAYVIDQ
ncbi:hypothetical protein P3G55_27125, partial [Leptospira sp. 96542]|nr:hypothetical protein [Leptospira sp. 96542]